MLAITTPGPAGCDDPAELFDHERRAVQVDAKDGLGARLRRRQAGGTDDLGDRSGRRSLVGKGAHRLRRSDVDVSGGDVISVAGQAVCDGMQCLVVEVGHDDLLGHQRLSPSVAGFAADRFGPIAPATVPPSTGSTVPVT